MKIQWNCDLQGCKVSNGRAEKLSGDTVTRDWKFQNSAPLPALFSKGLLLIYILILFYTNQMHLFS